MNKQVLTPRQMRMVEGNLGEYKDLVEILNWVTPDKARDAEQERGELIAGYKDRVDFLFRQTKPAWGNISPGCRICGDGNWSCLFINGKCNCRCFYCPTSQDDISVPTTNRLPFSDAQSYSDYIGHFGFQGVSISGGEPLLTLEKTLRYIQSVRKNHDDALHIWMYTNGSLVTPDIIQQLADAGLNEIRFDISARNYALDKIRLAIGHIPVVTVEIPAIFEDFNRLSQLLPVLHDIGVNHLNLHQLRLTPHNSRFLKTKSYSYLHGEKVTVLESELTALALLKQACDQNLALPINYCAFAYKNQFQKAATRKRGARVMMKGFDDLTETGLIRTLTFTGDAPLTHLADRLSKVDPDKNIWQISSDHHNIQFHTDLWQDINTNEGVLSLKYSEVILNSGLSYRNPFKEIRLSSGMKIYAEKLTRSIYRLTPHETSVFEQRVISHNHVPLNGDTPDFLDDEFIVPGLQEYF